MVYLTYKNSLINRFLSSEGGIFMFNDATLLRLFVSQTFTVYYILLLLPLKTPKRRNTLIVIAGALTITFLNSLLIMFVGINFYIRYYFLTLTLPYLLLGLTFSLFKGSKFIFVILTIQVIGNVTIINGLLASHLFYQENNPLIDTLARSITYLLFLPVLLKLIRPTFNKMAEVINRGWWVLNGSLILSYVLSYFILFVPTPIFDRPEYFIHAYIGMFLALIIFVIIFYLFIEIELKTTIENDKRVLSSQINTLTKETEVITNIAYKDALTGIRNRYSLLKQLNFYIDNLTPFTLVFMDLDNLKAVNDTYDHSTGDLYLQQFAKALHFASKNPDDVYRIAGDEFVCLITGDNDFNAKAFKQRIEQAMSLDIPYYGVSLGTAYYPNDCKEPERLIRLADQAMYVEKKKRKHRP